MNSACELARSAWLPPLLIAAAVSTICRATELADDPIGRELVQAGYRAVETYHAGHPVENHVLRVVYFYPNDVAPLPDYAARLGRVMADISDFYREGLRRFGIESRGLPLERKDGHLVLHLVRGRKPASAYHHESSEEATSEIRAALRGKVDLDREFVLVLYALCRKEPDGRYVFDAPYYGMGWSNQQTGLCHAADCELLDPVLLSDTQRKIVYTEHYYARQEQTLAQFNSWYIGGIAHELGHGLGLGLHDTGSPGEHAFGTSLMGGGNHTYRQERWQGGRPSFLSRATALQLISHPLFTASDRGRWESPGDAFANLHFQTEHAVLSIEGRVGGRVPAYGVVAHVCRIGEDEHETATFPAVLEHGRLALRVDGLAPDKYWLRLKSLHVNGATTVREFRLTFDAQGQPDATALNDECIVSTAETAVLRGEANAPDLVADDAIARAPSQEAARRLRILRTVLHPEPPIALSTVGAGSVYLSDVTWLDAEVGWGKVARNHYWFDENRQDGVLLRIDGEVFEKGLYAHAPSRYAFATEAKWRTFRATIGLRDGAQDIGSAVFTIRGDGRELYRSRLIRVGARQDVRVDIRGVKRLELLTDGGEGHNHFSWAIWANPIVER